MPRTRNEDEAINPVDTHVGARVKSRRLLVGWSQEELAKAIGLTFQQVQKYERGTNRISVSRLVDISRALKSPLHYFLEGCVSLAQGNKLSIRGVSDVPQAPLEGEIPMRRDVLDLVRAYMKITKPQLKKQLLEMAKAMASSSNDDN